MLWRNTQEGKVEASWITQGQLFLGDNVKHFFWELVTLDKYSPLAAEECSKHSPQVLNLVEKQLWIKSDRPPFVVTCIKQLVRKAEISFDIWTKIFTPGEK